MPLMDDISSSTEEINVWLGSGSVPTERAMAYLSTGSLMKHFTHNGVADKEPLKHPLWTALWDYYKACWSSTRSVVPEYLDTIGAFNNRFVRPMKMRSD
jgi:hypothetical protein